MDEAMCWLSILIPAYNVDRYVAACLQSVVAQASRGIEVLVVDDGSTDSTPTVIADWQRRHPDVLRVRMHACNRGIAATRNHLVSLARGDYLWFVDADDTLLPGAIGGLREVVDRHAPDLVLCDYRRSGRRGEHRGKTFAGPGRTILRDPSTILAGLFTAGQLHPWSKISRRLLWSQSLLFPEGRVFEDVAVMPRLASRAATVYHVPEAWVCYRRWEGSIVATMTPRKCIDLVRASAEYPEDVRQQGLRLSERALFASRHYAARHFIRAMRHVRHGDDPAIRHEARLECLSLFLRALDEQPGWLMRRYLAKGWLWRWARLRHAIREATRDSAVPGGSGAVRAA